MVHPLVQALSGRQRGLRQFLCTWNGIRIHSYPAMVYLGMVLALVAGQYIARLSKMSPGSVLIAMLTLTVAGLIGARLLHVATHWSLYRHDLRHTWHRHEGGAAAQGGLLLAIVASVPLLAVLRLSFGSFWDVASLCILIWLIFGKVGCLLHGCCSGRPSAGWLALDLPDHRGVWRHRIPSQLLEAGLALLLLLGAVGLWSESPFPGALFLSVVGSYGLGRLLLQPMRQVQDRLGPLNVQKALSLTLIALSLIGLLARSLSQAPGL